MLESSQQRILYRVLGIRCISQKSVGASIEIWQAMEQNRRRLCRGRCLRFQGDTLTALNSFRQ